MALSDSVRACILYCYLDGQMIEEAEASHPHHFVEYFHARSSVLFRCCVKCGQIQCFQNDWVYYPLDLLMAGLLETVEKALSYRYFRGENKRCMQIVGTLVD